MMAKKVPLSSLLVLAFAHPLFVCGYVIEKRAWKVTTIVASAALATIAGSCNGGVFLTCLTGSIASIVVIIFSSYSSGGSGETGSPVRDIDLTSTVTHYHRNGSFAQGFQPAWLEVGHYHKVTLGSNWEASASRLEDGYIHISAKIDQDTSLIGRARTWAVSNLVSRAGDDDPGDTGYVDVKYRDDDIGGTGLKNDGGTKEISNQVGTAVGKKMIDSKAETICASLVNPDTNGEIMTTEWFIRANDGSSGTTPAGACNNA